MMRIAFSQASRVDRYDRPKTDIEFHRESENPSAYKNAKALKLLTIIGEMDSS